MRSDLKIQNMSNKLKIEDITKRAQGDQEEVSIEKSVDSGVMVNEQITGTLELVAKIEQSLKTDVEAHAFTGRDNGWQDTHKVLHGRRQSVGNMSLTGITRMLSPNDLNESADKSKLLHSQQLNTIALNKRNID